MKSRNLFENIFRDEDILPLCGLVQPANQPDRRIGAGYSESF